MPLLSLPHTPTLLISLELPPSLLREIPLLCCHQVMQQLQERVQQAMSNASQLSVAAESAMQVDLLRCPLAAAFPRSLPQLRSSLHSLAAWLQVELDSVNATVVRR